MNEASQNVFADARFAFDQQGDSGIRVLPDRQEVEDPCGSYDGRHAFARCTLSEHRSAPPVSATSHGQPLGQISLGCGPKADLRGFVEQGLRLGDR